MGSQSPDPGVPAPSANGRIEERTVAPLGDPTIGVHTAQDSTAGRTHGHPTPVRTDKDGTKREETKSTSEYKAVLNADVNQPAVINVTVVTGSTNDQELSTPVWEGAVEIVGPAGWTGVRRTRV